MTITLIVLAVAAFFFIQGKIRADIVGICCILALMLFGILTPQEALSGFSNTIVMMLVCVFIVGGAVARTGLAKLVSRKILALAGSSENKLFVLIMLVTSGIGAFVSNTGTVAVMLPIVVSLASGAGASVSRFLIPLAFASTMGGMLTLIGTTPNMIISSALVESGRPALNFFAFLPIGVICVVVGTVTMLFMSRMLVKKDGDKSRTGSGTRSLRQLADEYQLKQTERRVRVKPQSSLVGKALRESDFSEFGASIIEIRRRREQPKLFEPPVSQIMPGADTVLKAGDTFTFVSDEDKVEPFARTFSLDLINESDPASRPDLKYTFEGFGIAELVILASSRLVNRAVKDSGLRENYGVRIIGIRRGGKPMLRNIRDERVLAGDALLVQGKWDNIARLEEEHDEWVVVGRPLEAASNETLDYKAPVAAIIVVLMIIAMAANLLPPVTASMLAALALIATKCFRNVTEAYQTISWQSVVLVASMLPVSIALEKTGAAAAASNGLIALVGDAGPYALLAAIYAATSVVTLFVSNTAAGALCTPIAMQAAINMGVSPYPFLFGVATAASMSLAFPFSTPPNVLVMGPGRYEFMDYFKMGAPLQIILGVIMVFVLPIIWPF